jgi:hypothetical protein
MSKLFFHFVGTMTLLSTFISSAQAQVSSTFDLNQDWTTNPYYGSIKTAFADVTGDGKTDAIAVNEDGVVVRRSDGAEFLANEYWTANPYYGSRLTAFADVTGDGKADAIVVNDDKVTVRRAP